MKQSIFKSIKEQYRDTMATLTMTTLSGGAFVDGITTDKGGVGSVKGACGQVSGFFSNAQNILQATSVAIVTIAVIMAGYQIVFARKHVADVVPISIGTLIIGAAGQITNWLIMYSSSCQKSLTL